MNKRDLEKFSKLIESEKQRVVEKLAYLGEEYAKSDDGGGNQAYSNHMADVGTDNIGREQALIHASQGSDYLASLDEAIKRIENGTYGICEECQNAIPSKRIEAFLAARLCIECKSRLERQRN